MKNNPLLFFKEFIFHPKSIGSLFPSSDRLACEIAKDISPSAGVVELGPGTGVITGKVLSQLENIKQYSGFEISRDFQEHLESTFLGINIVSGSAVAMELPDKVDLIISSLPFTIMEGDQISQIIDACYSNLKPGGELRIFLYAHTLYFRKGKKLLKQMSHYFIKVRQVLIWRNFPPAVILCYSKES